MYKTNIITLLTADRGAVSGDAMPGVSTQMIEPEKVTKKRCSKSSHCRKVVLHGMHSARLHSAPGYQTSPLPRVPQRF